MGFNGIIKVSDMTAQYKTVMRLTTVLRVRVTVKMKSVLTKRKNVDKNRGNATIELHSKKDTVLPQEGHHQSFQQMPQIDMFTSEWQPSSHTCQKLQKFFSRSLRPLLVFSRVHNSPLFLSIYDAFSHFSLLLVIITCFWQCSVCSLLYRCAPLCLAVRKQNNSDALERGNVLYSVKFSRKGVVKICHVNFPVDEGVAPRRSPRTCWQTRPKNSDGDWHAFFFILLMSPECRKQSLKLNFLHCFRRLKVCKYASSDSSHLFIFKSMINLFSASTMILTQTIFLFSLT